MGAPGPHDRSEQELKWSEIHFRSLIENASDVIAVVGRDGKLRYASPSLERVLGYRVSDLLGTDLMALVHPEEVEEARTCLSAEDATKLAPGYRDLRLRHRDGSWRVLSLCPTPLPESAGGPGLVLNAHDVTERRQLGEQIRQAAKMEAVGRLAAGVAHDFNNVLTLVIGHAELALMQLGPEDSLRANLREILAAAEHAASLTRQLLTFSRKRLIEPEVLDVRAVIGGMSGMLHRVIGEDVELVTAIDPTTARVRADRANLEQILLNLAVNARDAMRGGGRLTIEVGNVKLDERHARRHPEALSGHCVMLAVTDTGHGMDAETRRRIFEPFFTTKESGHGTGLGLATVYGIVEQLGGSILVDSEPGRGATFKVYLPRVEGDVVAPTAPDGGKLTPGEGTILVLDDDELVRGLARATLERAGYRVLVAGDFAAAERIFAGGEPVDLVIADVVMPRLEGEMARRWASREPAPSILFMSGYTDEVSERTGLLAGGARFLQKPFTPVELSQRVRELLAARS